MGAAVWAAYWDNGRLARCDNTGEIRNRSYVYVDKTAWFHRLATAAGRKMFFLARPRRFGKSLMISTFEAMFQGRRELFEGLAIMDTDWDWKKKYPVIHLNMGMCAAEDYETFAQNLPVCMKASLAGAGVKYDDKLTPSANFGIAIDKLADKGTQPPCSVTRRTNSTVTSPSTWRRTAR